MTTPRSDPDADPLASARYALEHFRHYDVPGSLADLYDALHPNTKETDT